jgi:hypothetical protein
MHISWTTTYWTTSTRAVAEGWTAGYASPDAAAAPVIRSRHEEELAELAPYHAAFRWDSTSDEKYTAEGTL